MINRFSENLKRFRIESGLTQKQLAQVLGFTQRKISYWESGKVEPDIDSIIILAKYFNVTTDCLFGTEE